MHFNGIPELGVRIEMPEFISPGDPFNITGYLDNSFEPKQNIPVFFILDVYGSLWFWDDWTYYNPPEHPDYDFVMMDIPTGTTTLEVIPETTWPDTGDVHSAGLWMYGAMLDPDTGLILGDYAAVEWGFGP